MESIAEKEKVMNPQTVELSSDLLEIVDRWKKVGRKEQDEICALEFGHKFARLFSRLPLNGATRGLDKPKALISMLGLSWQPVALMAAWVRPERDLTPKNWSRF